MGQGSGAQGTNRGFNQLKKGHEAVRVTLPLRDFRKNAEPWCADLPLVTVHGSVCSFCVSVCCHLSDCLSALPRQPQCWLANQHGRTCCALSAAFIWFAFAVHVVRSLFSHASLFSPVLCLLFISCLGLLLFRIGSVLHSLCALEIGSSAWDLLATHRASSLTVCH